MSDRRIEPEDLGGLEGLPPGDPRVRELDSHPRVRAQQRAYREFLAPGELPAAPRMSEAEARLTEVLERELGVPLEPNVTRGTEARAAAEARERRGFFAATLAPGWRPAFAALLVVVAGALLYTSRPGRPHTPVMRGPAPELRAGELAVAPHPEALPGGALRLSWTAPADAESYTIVFLSPELNEISRVADLQGTHFDLDPRALPDGLGRGQAVLYRVMAMRGADEVARSRTIAVNVPAP